MTRSISSSRAVSITTGSDETARIAWQRSKPVRVRQLDVEDREPDVVLLERLQPFSAARAQTTRKPSRSRYARTIAAMSSSSSTSRIVPPRLTPRAAPCTSDDARRAVRREDDVEPEARAERAAADSRPAAPHRRPRREGTRTRSPLARRRTRAPAPRRTRTPASVRPAAPKARTTTVAPVGAADRLGDEAGEDLARRRRASVQPVARRRRERDRDVAPSSARSTTVVAPSDWTIPRSTRSPQPPAPPRGATRTPRSPRTGLSRRIVPGRRKRSSVRT